MHLRLLNKAENNESLYVLYDNLDRVLGYVINVAYTRWAGIRHRLMNRYGSVQAMKESGPIPSEEFIHLLNSEPGLAVFGSIKDSDIMFVRSDEIRNSLPEEMRNIMELRQSFRVWVI